MEHGKKHHHSKHSTKHSESSNKLYLVTSYKTTNKKPMFSIYNDKNKAKN